MGRYKIDVNVPGEGLELKLVSDDGSASLMYDIEAWFNGERKKIKHVIKAVNHILKLKRTVVYDKKRKKYIRVTPRKRGSIITVNLIELIP